jgi:sigma-B regulation protein RsbU (phosphoserine phosphatase)
MVFIHPSSFILHPSEEGLTMNTEGTLLLVEDDPTYRLMLRRYLEPRGFATVAACDGAQALEQIRQRTFDLVLLDVLLPDMSGLDVLRKLREQYSATELPVVMATGQNQSSDVVEALRLGANDYLTKPFDYPVVLARVQTQLQLKRSVDQIRTLEHQLKHQNEQLLQANQRLNADLEAAARVQMALLPKVLPSVPGAVFAYRFRPCEALAGDLLNVTPINNHQMALHVLDVVGHGVASALLAVMVSRVLSRLTQGKTSLPALGPAEVADHLNREFAWDPSIEQYFTLLFGLLDWRTGEFRYVSAGHPGPILLPRTGPGQVIRTSGFPIGFTDLAYEEQSLFLKPGDRLYLYSDGLTEARNAEREPLEEDRLLAALEESRSASLPDSLDALLHCAESWSAPAGPHDDISLLAVEMTSR